MGFEDWLQQIRATLDPQDAEPRGSGWPAPTTDWPRNPALEDALRANPDAPEPLLVYTDWLSEQDVRGDVLAAALAGNPDAGHWGARHLHPGAALESWMLGPLARTLEIGPRHATGLRGQPFSFAAATLLSTLRLLVSPADAAGILGSRHTPCPIRTVVIDAGYDDLTPVWPTLSTATTLRVEKARSLGTIRAPKLRRLHLRTVAKRAYADLSAGWLPALAELEIQTEPDDPTAALSAALSALPLLDTVGVRSIVSGAFVRRLVASGCAERLKALRLPGARFDTIAALLDHAERFEHLQTLVLPTLPYVDGVELKRAFPHTDVGWSASSRLLNRR